MSMWRDQASSKKEGLPPNEVSPPEAPRAAIGEPATPNPPMSPTVPAAVPVAARGGAPEVKESLIAADITIEGKIEGSGHVRLAGRFKGDVNVKGDLTIERGAKLAGGVRANKVIIAGELEGNIDAAAEVELQASGILVGDVKAGTLTVAAGSRMRGQADFGWGDDAPARPARVHDTPAEPAADT